MRLFAPVILLIAAARLCAASAAPEAVPDVTVREDAITVVYDYAREHCAEWDTPDAPLRAFRDARGSIVAFASDDHSRLFRGTSLLDIHHTCHSSFLSRNNADPAAYADSGYVTGTWSTDGTHVMALIHNEYHAEQFPGRCLYRDSMKCWYTTILAARSDDGGRSFTTATPPVIIAGAAFREDVEQGRHRGFFNPSNIFFHNAFYYMATDTTGGRGQRDGLCLFRTPTIEDPTSWRGYDGHGFASRAIDPYRAATTDYIPCVPMDGNGTVGSISWHERSGLFLMVFQTVDDNRPNGYTGYAWSKDLVHWSPTRKLFDHSDMSSSNCRDGYRYGYPSVADPAAPGRNFDSIGDHPWLFLTRFHVVDCNLPPVRDLIRLPLNVLSIRGFR